ncbi:hypothetical protein Hypma_003463 [Hypsizygus marmoreus]|uniref:Uncharacterized protein n=1 Tax=Hypsizygus marmoreus TaxID=39966 RepID=A0A369J3R3_HYPMA|nr:hypothetical protein Hypma_003463 [Hypsizygus marmoreus]
MEKSLFIPMPPLSSASLTSSVPQNVAARSITPSNMSARGVALLTTEPVLGSASEALPSRTFLETPLALTPFYRDWQSLDMVLDPPAKHVYFDGLQIQPSSYNNDRDYAKIHTPYSAVHFRLFLEHANLTQFYPELPFKLEHRFPIGNLAPITKTYAPPNLPIATEHVDAIRAYIAEELRLSRFSGPFTRDALEAKIVNDEIDLDEYLTRWGKATDVAAIVTSAPPGAQAATLDVEGAYRTVPVKPDHKRYLVVHFEGKFYIDHDVPFGLTSALGLQGEVADATLDIWEYQNTSPAVKWVDDFSIFRFPSADGLFHGISNGHEYTYNYDVAYIKDVIAPLGIPWHKEKGQDFLDTFSYVGFLWDLPNKTVVHLSEAQIPHSLAPLTPTRDYNIWVDASTDWGIGLLWGGQWDAWRLLDGWRGPGRDIGWLEGVGIELAILATRAMGIHNADILIRSDNEGVIGAFTKGRSANFMTNLSIHRSDETPSLEVSSLQSHRNSHIPSQFLSSSLTTWSMSCSEHLAAFLKDVDIDAQAATFYANAPPMDVRQAASLPADGRIRISRKPCTDSHITPSAHHSHVLASDRVLLWTTPHSAEFQVALEAELPEPAIQKLFRVMLFSLDEETRSNYGAGLLCFTHASAAGTASSSTLDNWLGGLHYWHIVNGAPWHGLDMLHHVRCGFAKLVPLSFKRAKRPPVTIKALTVLKSSLDLSNAFDAAVWAVASVAFWSCCRLGELVIPSPNLFDPSCHVAHSSRLPCISRLNNGTAYATFHIPWTKTTLQEGADISITSRNHVTCPLEALKHHLTANSLIPDSAPLFAFETAGGGWAPMTKAWFMDHCNTAWVVAGFPSMPGHAFRIGSATELLLQGINSDVVATQGRWKSQAFLDYWCRIESILPLFISNASNSHRSLNLESTMTSFARRHRLHPPRT